MRLMTNDKWNDALQFDNLLKTFLLMNDNDDWYL